MLSRCRIWVQKVLDGFLYLRTWGLDVIVWLAIRLTAYELTFSQVKEKKKASNRVHVDLNLDSAGDVEGLLSHAKAQVDRAVARRAIVTDKCKTLFTFNTALLALIAIFQGKITELQFWESAVFYAAVVTFVVALLVLWTYFDVSGEIILPLEQRLVPLSKDDLKKSLVNSNLESAADIENRTDYLVDLYKTSRFFLMSGFVLLFIVFSHNYFVQARTRKPEPDFMPYVSMSHASPKSRSRQTADQITGAEIDSAEQAPAERRKE